MVRFGQKRVGFGGESDFWCPHVVARPPPKTAKKWQKNVKTSKKNVKKKPSKKTSKKRQKNVKKNSLTPDPAWPPGRPPHRPKRSSGKKLQCLRMALIGESPAERRGLRWVRTFVVRGRATPAKGEGKSGGWPQRGVGEFINLCKTPGAFSLLFHQTDKNMR